MQSGARKVAALIAALALAAAGALVAADTAKAAPKHLGGVKWGVSKAQVVAYKAFPLRVTTDGRTWS